MLERYENSMKSNGIYCSRTVVDSVVDSVVDFENLSLAEISLSTRNEIGAIAFQACTLSHSDTSLVKSSSITFNTVVTFLLHVVTVVEFLLHLKFYSPKIYLLILKNKPEKKDEKCIHA